MMSKYHINFGRWGENVAVEYLEERGYTIVERNLHTPYGEIDIIARQKDLLIFIEVKTRSNNSYGLPEASVTQQKQKHIVDAVDYYFQENPEINCVWRIDVIAIRGKKFDKMPEITHFQNAITHG